MIIESSFKRLGQVQLGTGLTTIYAPPTYPLNAQGIVIAIWITNSDTAARAVTLRTGSGTLTTVQGLIEAKSIPANDFLLLETNTMMAAIPAGDYIQGLCDVAAKVTVTIYGSEITA